MNNQELMKEASVSLRKLASEVEHYRESEEVVKMARDIVKTLHDKGAISSEVVFDKLAELEEKTAEELRVVSKAIELTKTGEFSFGSVSEKLEDNGAMDPITAMLLEDYT